MKAPMAAPIPTARGGVTASDPVSRAPRYPRAAGSRMTITPPPNSNVDIPLSVSAVSVDTAAALTSVSGATSLPLLVDVRGVADPVTLSVQTLQTSEAVVDAAARRISLAGAVTSVAPTDADGSESVTLTITGIPSGINVEGLTYISGTGLNRIWSGTPAQIASAELVVRDAHFSGTLNFSIRAVSTENDGNSLTGSVATDLRGGTNDIYVYDGAGMEIGHKAVAGSCASGSTWNDKKVCAPNAGWTYSEFALVVYEDNCKKIGWVDLASPDTDKVKELTNKTGHNEFTGQSDLDCSLGLGALPVAANDSLAKFADGTLLVSLVTAGDGNIRRWFPVNPVTKEILPEWTGAVPKNTLQSTGYGTWGDTPYADHDIGNKGMYASLASGLLYITNSDAARLRFTLDIENFATYDVISDRYAVLGGYQFAITVPAH